jgi:two-component sensor histidine kinase/CheY-like chemotaxis protein
MAIETAAARPTVLIVEDEMLLRMRAVDIVEDAGFTPLEAVNADDALALLESRSDIELLFTDIQMPGTMNGLKLAHAVHERWPLIKIILVSGQVTPNEEDRPANSRFFGKPVEVQQMIAELQGMIGRGSLEIIPTKIPTHPVGAPSVIATNAEPNAAQQTLTAENGTLRLLLEQAGIDAKALLAQAGIDAKEREVADKLQKLILEELHHRIKNTLATVRAITSQSLRTAISIEHGNELCTNTTKFGALSVPSGRVEIAWHIDQEKDRLMFTWAESGGPVVYAPIRRSFGTRLIGSLGQQLKGEVQLSYSPAGFAYALDVPMSSLVPA